MRAIAQCILLKVEIKMKLKDFQQVGFLLELKKILNGELGLFRNDDEVKEQKKQKEAKEELFRFDFSDDPDTISNQDNDIVNRRQRKNRTKSDTTQNKPTTIFVIEE